MKKKMCRYVKNIVHSLDRLSFLNRVWTLDIIQDAKLSLTLLQDFIMISGFDLASFVDAHADFAFRLQHIVTDSKVNVAWRCCQVPFFFHSSVLIFCFVSFNITATTSTVRSLTQAQNHDHIKWYFGFVTDDLIFLFFSLLF